MPASKIFSFLIVWGGIGIFAFSIFVVVAFRTGLVYTARKSDGTLKDRIPIAADGLGAPPMAMELDILDAANVGAEIDAQATAQHTTHDAADAMTDVVLGPNGDPIVAVD